MRRRDPVETGVVADTADRLAVMLRAGIVPERAWRYLAETDGGAVIGGVSTRIEGGERISAAISAAGPEWAPIANAWYVASEVGAPLAETLRAIAAATRDATEVADDVEIALAEPAMTARIMAWLPAGGLLIGLGLGFDIAGILLSQPVASACVAAGVVLMLVARRWSHKLVARARELPSAPGLHQELTAIALAGGGSVARAHELVTDIVGVDDVSGATARVLALSQRAGVPAVEILRQDAADERRRVRTLARVRAARLSGLLLLPLGVCTLPAFFLLGIAPMMISIISSTQIGW